MADLNVIPFGEGRNTSTVATPLARDLFGSADQGKAKVVFLNINYLDQESLLRLIARNAVKSVTDLRPRPVFGKPHFQHDSVIAYFSRCNIEYLEYALASSSIESSTNSKFLAALQLALASGLMVCLFDEDTRKRGWLYQFRREIRDLSIPGTEINPRSLAECPAACAEVLNYQTAKSEK